jgi:hypothetical protein
LGRPRLGAAFEREHDGISQSTTLERGVHFFRSIGRKNCVT